MSQKKFTTLAFHRAISNFLLRYHKILLWMVWFHFSSTLPLQWPPTVQRKTEFLSCRKACKSFGTHTRCWGSREIYRITTRSYYSLTTDFHVCIYEWLCTIIIFRNCCGLLSTYLYDFIICNTHGITTLIIPYDRVT